MNHILSHFFVDEEDSPPLDIHINHESAIFDMYEYENYDILSSYFSRRFGRQLTYEEMMKKLIITTQNNIKKREEGNVKMLERNITIQRMLRIQDYKNRLKMDELEEKERKIYEFRQQRAKLAMQRAQASAEVQKQKEEAVLKFDKLARQKKRNRTRNDKKTNPPDIMNYMKILKK